MFYFLKFFEISVVLGVTYIWNKFVLKKITKVINDEDNNDGENIFSSFHFLKYITYFYWLIAIIISVLLVVN